MGWDGYACRVQHDTWLKEDVLESLADNDPVLVAFQAAFDTNRTFGLEVSLASARLCCRATARMLARGTGEEPYNLEWWPDKVKALERQARWDFPVAPGDEDDDAGLRKSAQLFLELCAEHNLGVRFD